MVGPRLAALLVVAGCGSALTLPHAHVARGKAAGDDLSTVAARPVRCITTAGGCTEAFTHGLAAVIHMDLALAGYVVFDTSAMHAQRRERDLDRTAPAPTDPFSGLAADERADRLAAMGVDGVIEASIELGDGPWYEEARTVTVQIAVRRARDFELAWTARCSTRAGGALDLAAAVKAAATCAVGSAQL